MGRVHLVCARSMTSAPLSPRRAPYVAFWILALAFGWIEAAVVVYLRQIYPLPPTLSGVPSPITLMPGWLVAVEAVREACTLVLLATVAFLAARRLAERAGIFLLLFGVWDLTYYAVLWLVLGWPVSLTTWDVLFLLPVPWVAPVWAPALVAAAFVAGGSYLFWTAERARAYGTTDVSVLLMATAAVLLAFMAGWRAVAEERPPHGFPAALFLAGVVGGTLWFVHVEQRAGRARHPS